MVHLDKFYTEPEVALQCINSITNLESYQCIIEPSAGNGSFSSFLHKLHNNVQAIDIEPDGEGITKGDFLEHDVEPESNHPLLVIGNPPFGRRSMLAKAFIRHSVNIGADTIAFILPDTFKKCNNQRMFSEDWKLIDIINLPTNSFFVLEEKYDIPCSFFVWTKMNVGNKDLRDTIAKPTEDFAFVPRGSAKTDFCINGNTGLVHEVDMIKNPNATHYIVAEKKGVDELKEILSKLQYDKNSSVEGKNYWVNRNDILKAYHNYCENS